MKRVMMEIGYFHEGQEYSITVPGFAESKKKAKEDGYRKAMKRLKAKYGKKRYVVKYTMPRSTEELPDE